MTKRHRNSVSSFGPELMAVLVRGSRERIEIPFDDWRTMCFFQLRLQTLRGSMRREKHPNLELVERARTARHWDEDERGAKHNFRLVIEPQDFRFRGAILKAGIHVDEITNADSVLDDVAEPAVPVDPSTEPALVDPSHPDPYAKFKKG